MISIRFIFLLACFFASALVAQSRSWSYQSRSGPARRPRNSASSQPQASNFNQFGQGGGYQVEGNIADKEAFLKSLPAFPPMSEGSFYRRIYRISQQPPAPRAAGAAAPVAVLATGATAELINGVIANALKSAHSRFESTGWTLEASCPWENIGTAASESIIEAALDQKAGVFTLVGLQKRQEHLSTQCDQVNDGEITCTTKHCATVVFTVGLSDNECPHAAKCQCRALPGGDVVTCEASGKLDDEFNVTELKLTCSDDAANAAEETESAVTIEEAEPSPPPEAEDYSGSHSE